MHSLMTTHLFLFIYGASASWNVDTKQHGRQGRHLDLDIDLPSPDSTKMRNESTGVFVFAAQFTGSTSMTQLLMSANIATQCRNKKWACEEFRAWTPGTDVKGRLFTLAKYWENDFENHQAFLIRKLGVPNEWVREDDNSVFKHIIENRPLPLVFAKHGIREFKPHVILLWQPHCLHERLSTHATSLSVEDHKRIHLMFLDTMMFLKRRDIDFTVVNYGDLLYKPDKVATQLSKIPGLGKVDFDFVPTIGKDIYPENEFKTQGSVAEFAARVKPMMKNYNAELGACNPSGDVHFDKLERNLGDASNM